MLSRGETLSRPPIADREPHINISRREFGVLKSYLLKMLIFEIILHGLLMTFSKGCNDLSIGLSLLFPLSRVSPCTGVAKDVLSAVTD